MVVTRFERRVSQHGDMSQMARFGCFLWVRPYINFLYCNITFQVGMEWVGRDWKDTFVGLVVWSWQCLKTCLLILTMFIGHIEEERDGENTDKNLSSTLPLSDVRCPALDCSRDNSTFGAVGATCVKWINPKLQCMEKNQAFPNTSTLNCSVAWIPHFFSVLIFVDFW